jgi:hypothetical protein
MMKVIFYALAALMFGSMAAMVGCSASVSSPGESEETSEAVGSCVDPGTGCSVSSDCCASACPDLPDNAITCNERHLCQCVPGR